MREGGSCLAELLEGDTSIVVGSRRHTGMAVQWIVDSVKVAPMERKNK